MPNARTPTIVVVAMSNFSVSTSTYEKERGETTEWNDVLVKKGIILEAQDVLDYRAEKERDEQLNVERLFAKEDPFENKSIAQLDRMISEDDKYADDRALLNFRTQRMLELEKKIAAAETFDGDVRQIKKSDFVREVTEASKSAWIVLHLFKDSHDECTLMARALADIAPKFPHTRFLKIVSTECVEGFPDSDLPCLIIYHGGELQHQTAGLGRFGGMRISAESLEWELGRMGVVDTDLTENPMAAKGRSPTKILRNYKAPRTIGSVTRIRSGRDLDSDDDDDY